jgi:type VI secretion system protein VasG
VTITHDGIMAAVTCSHRYLSGRQLPDKAVDVLDTACTRVKMSRSAKPVLLDAKERELADCHGTVSLRSKKTGSAGGHCGGRGEAVAACLTRANVLGKEISALTGKWGREKRLVQDTVIRTAREQLDARAQ